MLDWIAGAIEISGNWLIGNKKRTGFVLNFVCQILWIVVAIRAKVYGLLLVVVPGIIVNIRNFIKWRQEERNAVK